ncbi:putative Rdx family selenoprotein [Rhizobium azooxidifex]|uniref:Putative Rdx family selenoprotein n=1 Tax=Mycoplana azooxidifex TaxID=1636188 RepID=A0A7W6GLT4_9HYPH|nr:hypothetical protein [Mycoplana azooxidifex]MBB3980075.1 putative Rdx family selenoprotein [Mycoplana azooxidifex]
MQIDAAYLQDLKVHLSADLAAVVLEVFAGDRLAVALTPAELDRTIETLQALAVTWERRRREADPHLAESDRKVVKAIRPTNFNIGTLEGYGLGLLFETETGETTIALSREDAAKVSHAIRLLLAEPEEASIRN